MNTICADELLHGPGELREDRELRKTTADRVPATADRADADPGTAPAARKRYEDFEVRASRLGDVLGGQVFPRVF